MILLPSQDKQWRQNNQSDILGNIWSSWNLDLNSNLGRLRISPRLLSRDTTTRLATLTTAPCAFKQKASKHWTISGTQVFNASNEGVPYFAAAALDSDPTDLDVAYSDMELFNESIVVSGKSNNVYYTNGTAAWTSFTVGASDVGPHPMTVYADKLYYLRGSNIIYSITTAWAVSAVLLTLGAASTTTQQIVWLRAASNRIWIGTINRQGGKAHIYEWDGVSSQVTKSYRLQSSGALACVIKDDIPWVMDANGRLLVFNGNSFEEVARLPVRGNSYLINATSDRNNRFIHPNGMSIISDRINLLISNQNSDNGQTINENLPSGVWEYDENVGLYHRYSFTYYAAQSGSQTDQGQNRVAVSASSSGITPVGALTDLKKADLSATANGSLLAGMAYYTDASTIIAGIFIDDSLDTIQKSGYFVTTWIDSQNVQDVWQKIFVTYKQLLNSTDKIVLKYRTTEAVATEISITWVDTTSFTTATDISGKVGQEVEVVQGTGSGLCSHITAVTGPSGGLYTATVDETYTGVTTGTAKARLQAWVKLGTVQNQTDEWSQFPIAKSSPRIQIKCCLLITGKNELFRLAFINQAQQLLA